MSGRQNPPVAAEGVSLPITPMLDMAFQLLMFFLFTWNAAAHEGQIHVVLPAPKPDPGGPGIAPPARNEDGILGETDLNVRIHKRQVGFALTLEEGAIVTPLEDLEALNKQLKSCFRDRAEALRGLVKGRGAEEGQALLQEELKKVKVRVQGDAE